MSYTFFDHLADALYETGRLSVEANVLREAIEVAAARTRIDHDREADTFRFSKYVDPDEFFVSWRIEDEAESVYLWPAEVAWLRAALLSVDETAGPQRGDPYEHPKELADGRLAVTYEPAHEGA